MRILSYIAAAMLAVLASCGITPPSDAVATDTPIDIYPDYAGVTVPCNIAPLNFEITTDAEQSIATFHIDGRDEYCAAGPVVQISEKKWRKMLEQAKGGKIEVDCYTKTAGKWQRHPAFDICVSDSEIDPFVAYRLIEPSYISFEKVWIKQRCLENFDESDIYNSFNLSREEEGQCVNCHSFQDYNRGGNMQMHLRVGHGGTLVVKDGEARKVNLKTPSTISAGVYPSWHPTLPLIAYSVNETSQNFHSTHTNKVEVQDAKSDLVLYDVEGNTLSFIACDSAELETFPSWSPDGKWLYYVSAIVPQLSDDEMARYQSFNYKDFKYNIFRRSFDPATRQFGPADTVFMASEIGKSATHPRVSPDGRFLMFTLGEYGTFHIWHKDADLYILDLQDGGVRPMDELNSPDVESYHSFASGGRWVVFSSRRDDGSYTRLYIAHIDDNGVATKPFLLPQKDPRANERLFRSYNVPEFMAQPVDLSKTEMIGAIDSEPAQATFK